VINSRAIVDRIVLVVVILLILFSCDLQEILIERRMGCAAKDREILLVDWEALTNPLWISC
jgi:hypothetical protein